MSMLFDNLGSLRDDGGNWPFSSSVWVGGFNQILEKTF